MLIMLPPLHLKLAERLFILNDRQLGVLTRLHYMKEQLSNLDYRPLFLPRGDKSYEAGWKVLLKKFPSTDIKAGQSCLQPFLSRQKELFTVLSTYYLNLVDILEIRDQFRDFLGCVSSAQMVLDITVNFDMTRLYLELISNHFALMVLLTRLPDVKAILILFNFLYAQLHGKHEPNFPRMAEYFGETLDGMLNILHIDVNPHSRILARALRSLNDFFMRRTVRAQNWSDGHFLKILYEPSKIAHTVLGDQLQCELIPYEVMERWVVFGYLLIYPELSDEESFNRLKVALRHSYVVVLFREEVLHVHTVFQSLMETSGAIKNVNKRISDIKETFSIAYSQTPKIHAERRAYLRSSLRQLHLMLSDEPGLLGPKAFLVFWGLSYASDEFHWLLKHSANPPNKKALSALRSANSVDELTDPFLPELLFLMDELRLLIVRYTPVIQKFYLQLLACHDGPGFAEYSTEIFPNLPSEEAAIFTSISQVLCELSEDPLVREKSLCASYGTFDFSAIRLDWLRMQASLSFKVSPINLSDYRRLVEHFHSTILHTKFVDYLDELLRFVSDMSVFMFYQVQFKELFKNCISCPAQLRFSIVFPSICTQCVQSCHDLCPEERLPIGHNAIDLARSFCQQIAEHICSHLFDRIDEFGKLADQLAPKNAVLWLLDERPTKKTKKQLNGISNAVTDSKYSKQAQMSAPTRVQANKAFDNRQTPGVESCRTNREEQTCHDKILFGLSQLCYTVNHHRELIVFDQIVNPREILKNDIQSSLIKILTSYTAFLSAASNETSNEVLITKPSELLRRVRALMNVLIDLENHLCIDVIDIFSTIFTQHTQPRERFHGQPTMTAHYAKWYIDNLIKHAYQDHFVYSPLLKTFVTLVSPEVVHFRAEDYADLNELLALAELIGPLGIRYICERLMQSVGDRVDQIKKFVLQNRVTLESLRECFEDPVKTKQLSGSLQHCDILLVLLKEIGVALAFRKLCFEAVNIVLEKRTPFLMDSVYNLRAYITEQSDGLLLPRTSRNMVTDGLDNCKDEMELINAKMGDQLVLNNLSASMGIFSDLDYNLCMILHNQNMTALSASAQAGLNTVNGPGLSNPHEDLNYHIACLFVVFVASAFPKLACLENSLYHLDLEANENNCHCIPYAVNTLMVSMFSLLRPGDLESRFKEFLALVSSNLLRLGLETSSSLMSLDNSGTNSQSVHPSLSQNAKHRDSIYIVFDILVKQSPYLSANLQEFCFPYSLIRSAYHNVAELTGHAVAAASRPHVVMSSSSHGDSKSRE